MPYSVNFLGGENLIQWPPTRTAQALARHSDILLTMNVYTQVNTDVHLEAINSLPAPVTGELF